MYLQATEHQRLQANDQKPGERPEIESPSQSSERINTANTSIPNFSPRTVETLNVCCLSHHPVQGTLIQQPWQTNPPCTADIRMKIETHLRECYKATPVLSLSDSKEDSIHPTAEDQGSLVFQSLCPQLGCNRGVKCDNLSLKQCGNRSQGPFNAFSFWPGVLTFRTSN